MGIHDIFIIYHNELESIYNMYICILMCTNLGEFNVMYTIALI